MAARLKVLEAQSIYCLGTAAEFYRFSITSDVVIPTQSRIVRATGQ
jgi:hypothetical protein